jgi:hypothetical protein
MGGKTRSATGNSPEDAKIYVVQGGKKHWVTSPAWVCQHASSFGNVSPISPEELDSIPTGEPFQ